MITYAEGVQFWQSFQVLMIGAVFVGVLAAHAVMGIAKAIWRHSGTWGRPSLRPPE